MRSSPILLLLTLAAPALATDGVLEINQTCALESGCFDGDTPGFPVTIPGAGSYRLTSQLTVTDQSVSGIEIGATPTDVRIDLNGFAIVGPGEGIGTGHGISSFARRTSVVDGTVKQWGGSGVRILADAARVERVDAADNGGDGIRTSTVSRVLDCSARSNGAGIFVDTASTVIGNVVASNTGNGIRSSGVTSRNTVVSNGGVGIEGIIGLVSENEVRLSGGLGLSGSSSVAYVGNVFIGNNGSGAQTSATAVELGSNLCNGNTSCP